MVQFDDLDYGWAVRPTAVAGQLSHLKEIISTWHSRFSDPDFIALLDSLNADEKTTVISQFINEMKMVTSKAATLVEVLS